MPSLLAEIGAGWSWSAALSAYGFAFDLWAFDPDVLEITTGMDGVSTEERFADLLRFVDALARATARPVQIGGESADPRQGAVLVYEPAAGPRAI